MRFASLPLSTTLAIGLFASACAAQSPAPAAQPNTPAAAVISTDVPDTHEDQATTRSVSQIRIVRLSQVRGAVQLDRKTDQKFETAFNNLPIIAGEQLRTQQGVAEVEFEDNSSLRLVTDSQADFPRLGRDPSGATTTTVRLLRGSMYVSLASSKTPSDFAVQVGHQTLTFTPASHLRIDVTGSNAKLTVFQGEVTATSDSGSLVVNKHKAITFDLTGTDSPVFARLDEPSPFDEWDKNAVEFHKFRAVAANYANTPYSYGVNDLSYYGSFSNVAGCGNIWRPYLATAAFDPYSSGVWTWYPGAGYSWVSIYPWGWAPYHSGNWAYCGSGVGWGWQPQGNWNGLQNAPAALKFKIPGTVRPHPPLPPVKGQSTLIGVNLSRLQPSTPGSAGHFVFHSDSAGLGVPRGVFNNLSKISEHAVEHGSVTRSLSWTQVDRTNAATASTAVNAENRGQGATNSFAHNSYSSGAANRSATSSMSASNSSASFSHSAPASVSSSFSSSSSSASSFSSASVASSAGSSAGKGH